MKTGYNATTTDVHIGDMHISFTGENNIMMTHTKWSTQIHFHNSYEFHYLRLGEVDIIFEDGQVVTLRSGDACIIPANIMHSSYQKSQYIINFNTTFEIKRLSHGTRRRDSEFEYYKALLDLQTNIIVFEGASLFEYITMINRLSAENEPLSKHRLSAYLSVFFIEMCALCSTARPSVDEFEPRNRNTAISRGNVDSDRRRIIENFVACEYASNRLLDKCSELLHLSQSQTIRVVQNLMGHTLSELVTRQRMSVARILIQSGELTLEQIAAQVGYSSYNGFYTAVKQYYELSPQELRERLG